MKDLNKLINKLENWTKKNGIDLYHGAISEDTITSILIDEEKCDFEAFVKILETKDVKYIVINSLESDSKKDFDKDVKELEELFFESMQNELETLFNKYKENDGKPYSIRIVASIGDDYFLDFIMYNDYFYVMKEIENLLEEYSAYFLSSQSYEVPEFSLSNKEIRSNAKVLSKNDRFQRAKNEKQRFYIAEEVFEEEEIDKKTLTEISHYASSFYEIDIKPVQERNLRKSIQKLKKQGMTKSEIASELDMSSYMVEKYF